MRNTVLIPIRLNDLEPPLLDSDPIKSSTRSSPIHPTTPLTDLIEEINAEEELLAYEIDACDDEYEADPNDLIDNVNTLNGNEGKIFAPPSSNQSTFVQAASNKQTNLYEQFKLLDLIDKILSYDSFAKIRFVRLSISQIDTLQLWSLCFVFFLVLIQNRNHHHHRQTIASFIMIVIIIQWRDGEILAAMIVAIDPHLHPHHHLRWYRPTLNSIMI